MKCGGFSITDVMEEHHTIVNNKKQEVEDQLVSQGRNGKLEHYTLLEVQQQVVAGMNYLFKIKIQEDGEECVFIKVFKDLKNEPHLTSIIGNKQTSDLLENNLFI